MKILITGATGFIGSHLTEKLVEEGSEARVLVKEERKNFEAREETWKLLRDLGVEFCYGDVLDRDSLRRAVKEVDVVFHLAAIARPMAIPDELYFRVNEQGTRNLLEVCRQEKKIKKIIIMSSVSAVGSSRNGEGVNEKTKCQPVDVYGWSKLAQEKVAIEYFKKYRLPIILLRPPMVFGPRDYEMLRLFRAINKGFFPINSNEKCMEFLYVENLVLACLWAMKAGRDGEIYHISNGEHYSINEIVETIAKAEEKKILPIKLPNFIFMFGGYFLEVLGKIFHFHPPFSHDTHIWMTKKVWYSDISKAKKEIKYAPQFSLEEGVEKTVRYYKKRGLL